MIRQLRRDQGQSQYTLAHRLAEASGNDGMTREQVARWERGKRIPSPYWRHWLSVVLGAPVARLDAAARYGRRLRALLRRVAAKPRRQVSKVHPSAIAAWRQRVVLPRIWYPLAVVARPNGRIAAGGWVRMPVPKAG
jgi:transcriptional regulator with XRE-family HTH domain